MESEFARFRVTIQLFGVSAADAEYFGSSAVFEPICVMGDTDQSDHSIHDGRFNAQLIRDRGPADQSDWDIFRQIAVVDIIGAGNRGEVVATVAHSIQWHPGIDLIDASKILQSMDIIAERLTNLQPLLVKENVNFQTGGLESVLVQKEVDIWLFDVAEVDKARARVYSRINQA